MIERVIEKVYRDSLGIKEKEKIIVIGDDYASNKKQLDERLQILESFKNIAISMGCDVKTLVYKNVGRHGLEPPEELWFECFGKEFCDRLSFSKIRNKLINFEELLELSKYILKENLPDVIIAISYYSTSHTNFRKLLNYFGCRYASMPMVEKEMFLGAIDVDYFELEKKTNAFFDEIIKYNNVFITNDKGTEIFINFKNVPISKDTGNLKEKGSFGNLPAGEVFLPPVLESTTGRINVEFFMGKKLSKPTFLYFENGVVNKVEGDNFFEESMEKIFEDERNKVIAELGFGTNDKAKNPVNVLEAEKISGTCHLAIGDNSTFGGSNHATVHIDFVIFNPKFRWGI